VPNRPDDISEKARRAGETVSKTKSRGERFLSEPGRQRMADDQPLAGDVCVFAGIPLGPGLAWPGNFPDGT